MQSRNNLLDHIEQDIQNFHMILQSETDKNQLENQVLDILWDIEKKVAIIIWDRHPRTALEKEKVFQRYIGLNHIASQYTSIDDFLDMLIAKLSQDLKKIKLTHDIFEKGAAQIEWNGISKEKIELKTAQKNKLFLRVLHKMGIDFSDVTQYEESLNPERMRKIPYQIYHIEKWENQKTVLISDQIGQATFVYDAIIHTDIFKSIEKWDEIEGNPALKIIYNIKSYEKNLEIALNNILTFEEKEWQIVNEDEERADVEKMQKVTPVLYFSTLSFSGFHIDLKNITKFITKNTTDRIQWLSFNQVFDGYLNYRLGIIDQKERQWYYGLIVNLLQQVVKWEIHSFENLDTKFQEAKEKHDTMKNAQITPESYFSTLSFSDFHIDLKNITKFTTTNTTDSIQWLNFRQVFDGYLNYRLGIKDQKERQWYHGLIVNLLQQVVKWEIHSFENLDTKFQETKEKRWK